MQSAKNVSHYEPTLAGALEALVWAIGGGPNAVEGNRTSEGAIDTLGSDCDDLSLALCQFHQVHTPTGRRGDRVWCW